MTTSLRRSIAGAAATLLLVVGVVAGDDGRGDLALRRADASLQSVAAREALEFLAGYVDGSGRVVRHDQGGDTVSEGQAYALLLAVAVADRTTFDQVWLWTAENLQRADRLLAWRWADGAVVDDQPAADADLDAAWALAIAERRWPDGGYGDAAASLAAAVEAHETATVADRRLLAAGPWSVEAASGGDPLVVNPSYASPVAEAVLVGDGLADPAAVQARRDGNRELLEVLVGRGAPPDWALVHPDGEVHSARSPTVKGGGRFGWDAVRVPLRFGASCDAEDIELAAAIWPPVEAGAGEPELGDHPARLVGAAGAAAAAGEDHRALRLLDEATREDREAPTYYGSALDALGRVLLTTDELGSCPALAAA